MLIFSYLAIFTKSHRKFSGLKIIKCQVVKLSILALLEPKLGAQYDFLLKRSRISLAKSIRSHIGKMLNYANSFRKLCLIKLSIDRYSSQNTEEKKLLQLLGKKWSQCSQSSRLLKKNFLKQLTYADLEWHMYASMKTRKQLLYLYKGSEEQLIIFRSSLKSSNSNMHCIGEYLQILQLSLKSSRCILYKYVKKFVHLLQIDCIIKENSIYLFRPSNSSLKNLTASVKRKLYHKNYQGRWRVNAYIDRSKVAIDIERLLFFWRIYYLGLLSRSDVLQVNQITDYILYRWQMK